MGGYGTHRDTIWAFIPMMTYVMSWANLVSSSSEAESMKQGGEILHNGSILQVRISHKGKRDIPKGTFYEMLRQAGIDDSTFRKMLGK